jgi:hypothetical protein
MTIPEGRARAFYRGGEISPYVWAHPMSESLNQFAASHDKAYGAGVLSSLRSNIA